MRLILSISERAEGEIRRPKAGIRKKPEIRRFETIRESMREILRIRPSASASGLRISDFGFKTKSNWLGLRRGVPGLLDRAFFNPQTPRTCDALPIWKSATQQVWKPALRVFVPNSKIAVKYLGLALQGFLICSCRS